MEKKEKKKEKQKQNKTSFPTDRGSFSSQRRLRYFALSLKLKDTRSAEFLAFVRPVVQWISDQSTHLVAVKCEVFTTASTRETRLCVRPATQQTRCPYFRQIAYATPLRMRGDLNERGLLT